MLRQAVKPLLLKKEELHGVLYSLLRGICISPIERPISLLSLGLIYRLGRDSREVEELMRKAAVHGSLLVFIDGFDEVVLGRAAGGVVGHDRADTGRPFRDCTW